MDSWNKRLNNPLLLTWIKLLNMSREYNLQIFYVNKSEIKTYEFKRKVVPFILKNIFFNNQYLSFFSFMSLFLKAKTRHQPH